MRVWLTSFTEAKLVSHRQATVLRQLPQVLSEPCHHRVALFILHKPFEKVPVRRVGIETIEIAGKDHLHQICELERDTVQRLSREGRLHTL
jgi:hypothetical protein